MIIITFDWLKKAYTVFKRFDWFLWGKKTPRKRKKNVNALESGGRVGFPPKHSIYNIYSYHVYIFIYIFTFLVSNSLSRTSLSLSRLTTSVSTVDWQGSRFARPATFLLPCISRARYATTLFLCSPLRARYATTLFLCSPLRHATLPPFSSARPCGHTTLPPFASPRPCWHATLSPFFIL